MNVRHLRYFVAASEHGSFRKAAVALGVQESTISRRIRDLEGSLGSALFHRYSGGVRLTVAGQRLLSKARKVLRYVNEGVKIVDAVGRVQERRLREPEGRRLVSSNTLRQLLCNCCLRVVISGVWLSKQIDSELPLRLTSALKPRSCDYPPTRAREDVRAVPHHRANTSLRSTMSSRGRSIPIAILPRATG
ncbi:LysR family transcriptional regulator [Rhizobium gallicum]|uniref:LysR family transcriptional regulator n=1 Tax=Rhizobium gallicum TaxID=56730 RepID=UPI001EF7E652|nr:LysR family transcriptional regulator [Rhizobium gallicum]ULJ76706.1 LysR family transcriptional regulator [Rhizobium gallicum]